LQFLTSTSGFISYTTSRLTHSSNTNSAEEHDSRQQKEIEVSHPVSADMSSGTAVACQQQLLAPTDMSSLSVSHGCCQPELNPADTAANCSTCHRRWAQQRGLHLRQV
jgi:hypothetical protein